ncbi:hypothetical protein Pst134EA_019697 [Puccinia striiformis f. sp. tritici]|uniref:hypothetical protein n=1 Tax=Puccinia striiformis f. sp. tritici TaxID=168172 RepID=UPI002007B5D0|nr:hypothetical protein Pst134EA_019697 [Puccinia striiformis f. sp. tritici]KAH9459552.1 hypothetical protein Pst134EA_019697 [Puccinia striiformis f. sp. tritici]
MSSSTSTSQGGKKSRQSISTSTLHPSTAANNSGSNTGGPRLSANPAPISKPTLKKRSKSLGGAALEQKILRDRNRDSEGLTIDFDLTPRKKARRSLVPGKSILKSRPGLGLERTTSDNTLTLHSHSYPLPSLPSSYGLELTSSQLTDQFSNIPATTLSQPTPARQDRENYSPSDNNNNDDDADNSSDMDLSDDQGLHRSSLGSNTATLLRRVSFAAKAHVRTFGSPLVDPDCSMASSTASAPSNELPYEPPIPSSGVTNSPEGDQTADMSIDNSLTNDRMDPRQPPETHQATSNHIKHDQPSSRDAFNQAKASRLSMAIPGFGSYDDDEDEDEDEGGEAQRTEDLNKDHNGAQSVGANQASDPSHAPLKTAENQLNPSTSQEDQDHSQDMDITTPFQPIPTNTIHPRQEEPSGHIQRPKSSVQSGIPRLQSSATNYQQRQAFKSSRLSVALPEYLRGNRPDETENLEDSPTPSLSTGPTQPAGSTPAITPQPPPNDEKRRAMKTSRLSVALPEYLRAGLADDTDDIPASTVQSTSVSKSVSQSAPQSLNNNFPDQNQSNAIIPQDKHTEKVKSTKASRLTNFLGFSQEDEVPDDDEELEDPNTNNQPSENRMDPENPLEPPPPRNHSNKPSRLTQHFPTWDDLSRELDNAREADPGPSLYSEDSEPVTRKNKSRISEFLQPADSSDIEESNSPLIDYRDPTPNQRSSRPSTSQSSLPVPGLQNIQEHEDLINMSFEDDTQFRKVQGINTSNSGSALPGSSRSGLSIRTTSVEPLSRAGSFPRTSLEPALPRLSAIRGLPHASSASPSRRLSGSLSGSPKRVRLSFASPRRSTFSIGALNQSSREDSVSMGDLPRSKSTDPSTSVRESESDTHQPPGSSHSQTNQHLPAREHQLHSSSMPPPSSRPVPPSPTLISLNEFFEQAEIRFISLSQPRVRNYDQQEHPHLSDAQSRMSNFAQQIFAGMVKIPRLRLLESSSRTLRQKTEILDFATKEHESEISRNAHRYKLLQDWVVLQQRQAQSSQSNSQTSQKHAEDLNQMMNQLRLKKNWVEMSAKQDSHLFDIDMWKTYQANLAQRTTKLSQDLERMRRLDSIVRPATESLRDRKQNLTEEIRRRKQKLAEIESCDQGMLKALKEEAKDLAAVTEANRRALAESEFERNLWLEKFAELEAEKKEHVKKIEQMKLDPDQSQKCTVQELIRLKNELITIQAMMGWEMGEFEDNMMTFTFLSIIGVTFHLDPLSPGQAYRNVGRVELCWKSPTTLAEQEKDLEAYMVEQFFFGHLKAHYQGKRVEGRAKDFVQEITSIWNHARQLSWEIKNARTRFVVAVKLIDPSAGKARQSVSSALAAGNRRMNVIVTIRSPRNRSIADCHFEFNGEEVLDWRAENGLAHVSCKVTPVLGKLDCMNLKYVLSEHIDKGQRGALKESCLEAQASLDA